MSIDSDSVRHAIECCRAWEAVEKWLKEHDDGWVDFDNRNGEVNVALCEGICLDDDEFHGRGDTPQAAILAAAQKVGE